MTEAIENLLKSIALGLIIIVAHGIYFTTDFSYHSVTSTIIKIASLLLGPVLTGVVVVGYVGRHA